MPKAGNSAQKAAARHVQRTLDVRYTDALNWVITVKRPEITWSEAAAIVIRETGHG